MMNAYAELMVFLFLGVGAAAGACRMPERWHGSWFQAGLHQPVNISADGIDFRGQCVQQAPGKKFLLKDPNQDCRRCLVLYETHPNVLQYKESHCNPSDSMDKLCRTITGESLLYTFIRHGASPIPCPFSGAHTMSYTRGHGYGWCKEPVSQVQECTMDSRLLFRFHACPDVRGSESSVEELECLAIWKEGRTHYLIGRFYHDLAKTEGDRYRCFVYTQDERDPLVSLGQSGDGTCNGMFAVTDGARRMKLTKVLQEKAVSCRLPDWLLSTPVWHDLFHSLSYRGHRNNASILVYNTTSQQLHKKMICHQKVGDRYIFRTTEGCETRYVCVEMHSRHDNIMELQEGQPVRFPDSACSSSNFPTTTSITTLLASSNVTHDCPKVGKFRVVNSATGTSCNQLSHLLMGCTQTNEMQLHSRCDSSEYSCHGSWTDNKSHYIVASGNEERVCFTFTGSEESGMVVTAASSSCHPEGEMGLRFNVSGIGSCEEPVSSSTCPRPVLLLLMFFTWFCGT